MPIQTFFSSIDYSQAVIASNDGCPNNMWDDEQVAQGFSWREGCVSFGVPHTLSMVWVEIWVDNMFDVEDALSILEVPFVVNDAGISYGDPVVDVALTVPPGRYRLVYGVFPGFKGEDEDFALRLRFAFVPDDAPGFKIVKAGEGQSSQVLKTTALPADFMLYDFEGQR